VRERDRSNKRRECGGYNGDQPLEGRREEPLKATPEFQVITTSDKGPAKERDEEIRSGGQIQEDILVLLNDMDGTKVYHDRHEFRKLLESVFKGFTRFPDHFWNVMIDALVHHKERTSQADLRCKGQPKQFAPSEETTNAVRLPPESHFPER
jgi:hypothetical protein